MNKQTIYTKILLVVGVLALVNFLNYRYHFRADLTDDGRFTLSDGVKSIISNLEDPVTVKAYVNSDINSDVDYVSQELFNLLGEFEEISDGNLVVDHVDPDLEDKELVQSIQQEGLQAIPATQQKVGELQQKIYFCGLVIEYGDDKEVIPQLGRGMSLEYPIARAIKRLTYDNKKVLGIISGTGTPNLQEYNYIIEELKVNFSTIGINLATGLDTIDRTDALLIVDHQDSFSAEGIKKLDAYMASGKSIFLVYGNNGADVFGGNGMASERNMPIEGWLNTKGIQINNDLVRDANSLFNFVYLPVIQNFGDHPITKEFNLVGLNLSSSISFSGDKGTFTPLLYSGNRSGADQIPTMLSNNRQWTEQDFQMNGLVVGGLYEEGEGKLLLISSKNFLKLENYQQLNNPFQQNLFYDLVYGNINLVVNAMDWMNGINDLTEARNKVVAVKKFELPEDPDTIRNLKYLNFLLPILLVIIYGFVRSRMRKTKQLKWKALRIEE